MTGQPRAFFAVDLGSATTSVSLIGFVGERWRLVARAAGPADGSPDPLLARLAERAIAADADLIASITDGYSLDPRELAAELPRLEARSAAPAQLAVLAPSRRQRRRLEEVATSAGWRVVGGSADEDDALRLTALALAPETDTILVGADEPPSGDERRHLAQLTALAAAVARRRPELRVVLAGGATARSAAFADIGMSTRPADAAPSLPALPETPPADERNRADSSSDAADEGADVDTWERLVASVGRTGEPGADRPAAGESGEAGATAAPALLALRGPASAESREAADLDAAAGATAAGVPASAGERPARNDVLLAPPASAGAPPGSALQRVLEELRCRPDDARLAIARSVASLAYVLDRSVEAVEVGASAGLRCRAEPLPGDGRQNVASSHAAVAAAALLPEDLTPAVVDAVIGWSTIPLDRYRLGDRLRDLRGAPWTELDGEGLLIRLAAARAAVERLVAVTPELSARPLPDLVIASGGVWAGIPAPVVALVLADLVRRPGATQIALDEARLLGPLGVIDDEGERRRLLADLADDLLVPLGSLVVPGGLHAGRGAGRAAGRLRVRSGDGDVQVDLQPGGIEIVDLPPGQSAVAELDFRDTVRLGARGRHFVTEVTGGLGGLLVDLRDVPMRLPERADARRALLESWQRALWPGLES